MKNFLALLLLVVLVLAVSACQKKEEPPKEILPPFEEDGHMVYPQGNGAHLHNWEIVFQSYHTEDELDDKNYSYELDENAAFIVTLMEVTNNDTQERVFLPIVNMGGMGARLYPTGYEEEVIYEAENMMGYSKDPFGVSFEPGETKTLQVVYVVSKDIIDAGTGWRMEYTYENVMEQQKESIFFAL